LPGENRCCHTVVTGVSYDELESIKQENKVMKNAINWFEIPSSNFERAVMFYETILGATLRREASGGVQNGVLPYEQDAGDTAVGGAVVHNPHLSPGQSGVVPYLNCNGTLDAVLARVAPAGGRVLMPRTDIGFGFIALIHDSEGNTIGLHTA
jgi:predicted enzyme related to lactoylglutathione lyase